jgi:hypothetical protein
MVLLLVLEHGSEGVGAFSAMVRQLLEVALTVGRWKLNVRL